MPPKRPRPPNGQTRLVALALVLFWSLVWLLAS